MFPALKVLTKIDTFANNDKFKSYGAIFNNPIQSLKHCPLHETRRRQLPAIKRLHALTIIDGSVKAKLITEAIRPHNRCID